MQNIDIRSAQNVRITYELASLRDRILAFCIDMLIVFVGYYFFMVWLLALMGGNMEEAFMVGQVLFLLAPIALFTLYHFLCELFLKGQSIGKKASRLKVVRQDGKDAGMTEALMRAVLLLIDFLLSAGGIAIMLISSSSKRQRLGDMAANTVVIRIDAKTQFSLENIEKIETLENYTPQYPEAKMYGEEDMLFIKGFIERYRAYPNAAHEVALDKLVRKLCKELELEKIPVDKIDFLKTLIKDYIVLTR